MKQPWYRRWFQKDEPPKVALFPHLPIHERACPRCREVVTHWMTFTDGTISCATCVQRDLDKLRARKARLKG